jgi:methionyl-tRNA formyltransferase
MTTGRKKVLLMTGESTAHRDMVREALGLYDDIMTFSGPVTASFVHDQSIWAIISDRNGHILKSDVIDAVEGRAFNSHPSLLPLHRGWQPIFFSVWYKTAVGVSIHQVDAGLDTGHLVYQSEIGITDNDRLDTVHFRCRLEILKGWVEAWSRLRDGNLRPWNQIGRGSYHSRSKFESLFPKLPLGWKTPVRTVAEIADATGL